jgi:hypothetical protein
VTVRNAPLLVISLALNMQFIKKKKNKENESIQKKRDAERRLDDAELKRYRKK